MFDYFNLNEYYPSASLIIYLLIIVSYAQPACSGLNPYKIDVGFAQGANTFFNNF